MAQSLVSEGRAFSILMVARGVKASLIAMVRLAGLEASCCLM